jgi:hypothetical protein
VDVGEKKRA